MQHPKLILIPGKDLPKIKQKIKNLDVKYKVKQCFDIKEKTQLQIKGYDWSDNPNEIIYLNDIIKGLKLPFFKPELVELEWDIKSCFPQDWSFIDWEIDLVDDIDCWFSTDPKFKISITDKDFVNNIVNNCIHEENKILKLYKEALMSTFLHPHIQTLINCCVCHKEAHIDMWENVKEKFGLEDQAPRYLQDRNPADILKIVIENLNEAILIEEFLEPSTIECLVRFTAKDQLTEFTEMIERRDKESKENAKLLKILRTQVGKMYPFLNKSIDCNYINQQKHIKHINNHLTILQFTTHPEESSTN